ISQRYGVLGLLALAALLPVGVVMSSGNDLGLATRPTAAGTGGREDGRRLQVETYEFATQLEMTVCLSLVHTTDAATINQAQFKAAVIEVLGLEKEEFVKVDPTINRCTVDDWEMRASIYNVKDDATGQSASEVASAQVDRIYYSQVQETSFFSAVASSIKEMDSEIEAQESDFDLESLGFLVIWLDANDEATTASVGRGEHVVSVLGTDVWWPWWSWLIYAAVVAFFIIPALACFFKWRREKEAEDDTFMQGAKGTSGAPVTVGAGSSNPYGSGFRGSGEEFKNGGQ
ncbi:unnamed protein product, partial [Discosporangium mesarthrocarpum]